ncbi:MAG: hypothetical protein MAG715_01206 [Methanonatronarchaeales archaeon]|nr:hypothetical protein [Methanonatronarchaeales archaeon]
MTTYLVNYASLALLGLLVIAAGYGSATAKVRYYRFGMILMFVGFLLNTADGVIRISPGLDPGLSSWPWLAGNFFVLAGVLTLTWYRGRLGL